LLTPYHGNIGKRIVKSPKIFFTDCGLLCHLLNIRRRENLISHPLVGFIYENYCLQENIKYFENRGLRPEFYFIKTQTGLEIDLLIELEKAFVPIEIKFTKTVRKKMIEPMEYFYSKIKNIRFEKGYLFSLLNNQKTITTNIIAGGIKDYFNYLDNLIQ